jgi:hypothetical protein
VSNPEEATSAGERIQDLKVVADALAEAVGAALRRHKRAGNPVPEWRDGRVQWVAPEDIPDVVTTSGQE